MCKKKNRRSLFSFLFLSKLDRIIFSFENGQILLQYIFLKSSKYVYFCSQIFKFFDGRKMKNFTHVSSLMASNSFRDTRYILMSTISFPFRTWKSDISVYNIFLTCWCASDIEILPTTRGIPCMWNTRIRIYQQFIIVISNKV